MQAASMRPSLPAMLQMTVEAQLQRCVSWNSSYVACVYRVAEALSHKMSQGHRDMPCLLR